MARKSKNVGLIGLGIIGSRIAAVLRKRGFQVFVWNRTPRPEQNFVGSAAEVAELCDLVQLFVADDEALLEMARQLSPALTAHHVVTAHCTVAPASMRAAAAIVQRRGARFLDAPFTGSKVAAENGQLVYYIAGDEAALKQVRPILEASSKEIVLIGENIGDATVLKVATNLVTAATAQVAAEALALVRRAGVAPELFGKAMKNNATNSASLEMKVPMMLAGNFEPHFSVKHMLKDVRIGLKLAREFSLDLPVTEASGDMLLDELKRGRGDADYSSVAQKYFPVSSRGTLPEPMRRAESFKVLEPLPEIKVPEPQPVEPAAEADPEARPAEQTADAKPADIPRVESAPEQKAPEPKPAEPEIAVKPPALQAVESAPEPKPLEPTVPEYAVEMKPPEITIPQYAVEVKPPEIKIPEYAVEVKPPEKNTAETTPNGKPSEPVESASKPKAPEPRPAEEATETKPIETRPGALPVDEDEDEHAEEIPEGVNLSGGFRSWLSRRFSKSRRKS
ncbi:MAG TPA: NAD(P)-binding domain-containing protein [Chthoniobacterales bacterium]|nr:NAD(P)-binding domain-containing protein [Chthoniobacterales bacterium]